MALHPNFPRSPYDVLPPDLRWFPAAEELRSTDYIKLLPPLVAKVREEVKAWRDAGYAGACATSRTLLGWWFDTDHLTEQADGMQSQFRYYFAQREAVETVVWLLVTKASRFLARSPWSAPPSIWFLSIGSQFTLHASFPHSVALMQLRFTSFAVTNLRRDLHPQERAHAGRTRKMPQAAAVPP